MPFRRPATGRSSTPMPWRGPRRPIRSPGLAKQRFRWSFGTLQCLWKHADVTLRPRYGALGLVALPQAWLFQILLGLDLAVRRPAAHRAADRRCVRLHPARRAVRSDEPQGHALLLCALHNRRLGDGRRRLPVREARELAAALVARSAAVRLPAAAVLRPGEIRHERPRRAISSAGASSIAKRR